MLRTERISFSAIGDWPRLTLPGGARLVVWVIVNVEEWNARETMPRTVLTPSAGGSPMPDIPNCFNLRAALAINGLKNMQKVSDVDIVKTTEVIHAFTGRRPLRLGSRRSARRAEDARRIDRQRPVYAGVQ
jgi:hypothetical protein